MCPADVESTALHRDKDKAKDKGEGMHKDKDMDKEKKFTSLRALYLYIVLGLCTFQHTALHFVSLNTFFTELVPPGWIVLQQSLSR